MTSSKEETMTQTIERSVPEILLNAAKVYDDYMWIKGIAFKEDGEACCSIGALYLALGNEWPDSAVGGEERDNIYNLIGDSEAGQYFAWWLVRNRGNLRYWYDSRDRFPSTVIYRWNDSGAGDVNDIREAFAAAANDYTPEWKES
jgi:hypothetical protein